MSIFKTLFLSVFVISGMVIMSLGMKSLFAAYQAKSWSYMDGRILEADCREAAEGTSARHVKYMYIVASKQYINDREAFGGTISNNECTAGYRIGQSITVFYNPANPSDSVLNPKNYRPSLFKILFGLIFIGVGLLPYFAGRKKEDSTTPSMPTEKSVVYSVNDYLPNVKTTEVSDSKNQILQQMPVLNGEHFICQTPTLGMTSMLVLGFVSIGFIVMTSKDWVSFYSTLLVLCLYQACLYQKHRNHRFIFGLTSVVYFSPIVTVFLMRSNKKHRTGYLYLGKMFQICNLLQ